MNTPNPLLSDRLAFDLIQPAHVEPAIDALLAEARQNLARIADAEPTWEGVGNALDVATARLETAMSLVSHLESTRTSEALREAYNAVRPKVSAFYAGIPLDAALWTKLKALAPHAASLEPVRRRFVQKSVEEFRRSGADLGPVEKARLEAVSHELAVLTGKLAQNVVDATVRFELIVTEEVRLSGLPESARTAARESARQKGVDGWRFTLQAPSYLAVMQHADDASLREQLYRAYAGRAREENAPLVSQILALRKEQATLLGFADFAGYVLEDRMAKDGATARAFVRTLREKVRPAFERERAELWDFRKGLEGLDAPPPSAWDVPYYAEKQRKQRFDFDEEALRPYLPLPRVLGGLFEIVEKLFGVRIEPRPDVPVWHPDVRAYGLVDVDGREVARFATDLHPRDDKRDGAWMGPILTGDPDAGVPHFAVVCANLTPPVGDAPALLTHREVETLFHEVGHMLHHAFSRVPVRSLGGTRVAWDFVELPSQLLENWTWSRASLDLFARHVETGAPVPDALFERMTAARTFRAASDTMRQLGFAEMDLALHCDFDPARDGDVVKYARALLDAHSPAPLPEDHAMVCSFTHLFASPVGYACGYYSYKWAEALDADAFTRFEKEGILSATAGHALRTEILEKGDSEDPAVLYRAYMGRDPDPDALLRRAGLVD